MDDRMAGLRQGEPDSPCQDMADTGRQLHALVRWCV